MYLSADGLKLSVTVLAKGEFLESDQVRRYLIERFEEDGVDLTREGSGISRATYVLRIAQVSDDLIPARSKVILCQGSCELELVHEDETILRSTLRSRVVSGTDREEIHRTITDYLKKAAYRESARALDEVLFE